MCRASRVQWARWTSGTVNFASGMVREVAVSGVFFRAGSYRHDHRVREKDSPFALRVVTAVVAVAWHVLMGTAYTDVFGNPVWTNAPATVLSFVAGDLAMGLIQKALRLASRICPKSPLHTRWLLLMWCLPLVWRLRLRPFSAVGISPVMQVVGLVVAPVASAVLTLLASKFANKQTLAIVVRCSVIGVAVARYAFYATCAL